MEQPSSQKRLYRSAVDRMIGGVCGGFAEYLNIDSTLVRILWLVFTFTGGFGIIAYLACLIVMRENPYQNPSQRKPHNTSLIVGIILILLGLLFFSSTLDWDYYYFRPYRWHIFRPWAVSWDKFWPILIIVAGVLYIYHILKKEKQVSPPEASVVSEPAPEQAHPSQASPRKFTRSRKDKMIGGVCSGIAEYLNIDPVLMRVLWILVTLFSGVVFGVIAYIVLLIIIPEEEPVEIKTTDIATQGPPEKQENQDNVNKE